MRNRIVCNTVSPAIACVLLFFSHLLAAQESLTLGIHPYKSTTELLAAYGPFADYLAQRLDTPVTVTISRDYRSHIDLVGEDKLDIAYLGPASYVKLVERYGTRPILARQAIHGKPFFQGVIITASSSSLQRLEQLQGKRFAFGDTASTMSHLVPRYMLHQAGIDADNLAGFQFLGSHDNVALAVLSGDYDAGAVKEAVFEKYKQQGLRSLAMTPPLSEHLFVASTRLSSQRVAMLKSALMALDKTADGRAIMENIKPGMTAMLPASDDNYHNLREILHTLKMQGVIE